MCIPQREQLGMCRELMHPKLADKIHNLVSEGITNVPEITIALKYYVNHTLCPDSKSNIPDRAYYPTDDDIRNHIYTMLRNHASCHSRELTNEN